MSKKIILLYIVICMLFLGTICSEAVLAAEQQTICVIKSRSIQPYREAYSGFQKELSDEVYNVIYKEYDFQKFVEKTAELVKEIDESKANLVFVIGTEAAVFARKSIKDIPVVFTMVLNPVESGIVDSLRRPGGNISGVCLNIPIEVQFKVLKRVIPRAKKVGMLYDKRTKSEIVREAELAAAKAGLKLISKPIYAKNEISPMLDKIFKEADCLWASVDPMIYNSATARHIILSTLKEKIPFMAFSEHFVKAGALMALECDYYDIGQQTAKVAVELLKGVLPHDMSIKLPRKTKLVINVKTAENIGINIPQNLLDGAIVYGK
ncbi:MAG: ABC transporter substrate-binding protein [Candidatus Omnitrophota bacterium]